MSILRVPIEECASSLRFYSLQNEESESGGGSVFFERRKKKELRGSALTRLWRREQPFVLIMRLFLKVGLC